MEKVCKKCNLSKLLDNFYKRSDTIHGYRNECKKCINDYVKKWRSKTNRKYPETTKLYEQKNKEKFKKLRKEIHYNRLKTDVNYKLKHQLRTRLNNAINRQSKKGSSINDLGCSIEELKQHLESKFQPGMSWNNWSRTGWHIDHIIPLSNFDLTNREQFLKACHYTNLRPLWAIDNLKRKKKSIS